MDQKEIKKKKFPDGEEIRMVVIGGFNVGKSSLTLRFVQGEFPEETDPTIEDSYRKQVEIDGCTYYLDILDTAGQEEYAAMRNAYLASSQIFFIIFSITDLTTFAEIPERIEQIQRVKDIDFIDGILIGNKTDLEDQREVSREEAMEVAEKYHIPYMETSAKTGDFVEESFFNLVRFANGETIIPQQMSINIKKAR